MQDSQDRTESVEFNQQRNDSSNSPPPPPDGYNLNKRDQSSNRFRDFVLTKDGLKVLFTGIFLAVISFRIVPFGVPMMGDVVEKHSGNFPGGAAILLTLGLLGIAVVTVIIHEHIHKWVNSYFGYNSEIGYGLTHCYAMIESQWIKRSHNIISYVSPLIIISSISYILCITTSNQTVMVVFGMVFVINNAASCNDLLNAIDFSMRPNGTLAWLQWEDGEIAGYIYEPIPLSIDDG